MSIETKGNIRVLCIGDPHFTEDSFLEMEKFSKKTMEIIESGNFNLVVVLGDILDRFEKAHTTVHTQAMKWLYQISIRCQLLLLIGNHDRINNNVFLTDESFFWACHHWKNTTVADIPVELNVSKFRLVAVPYVVPGRFEEALSKIDNWKSADVIFAHQEMKGCSLGIVKSENGDPWSDEYPLLISGHIHEYERIGKNIIYVGTPRMKTFGDHQKKTVSIFTFKEDKTFQEERIDLGLPKKISIKLTIGQLTSANEFLNLNEDLTGSLKIVVQGTGTELSIGMKHPIVKHLKSLGVKIIPEEISNIESKELEEVKSNQISRTELQKKIWDRMAENPELLNIMKSLFGTVKLRIK